MALVVLGVGFGVVDVALTYKPPSAERLGLTRHISRLTGRIYCL